jgi:hypothetical protein
MADKSVEAYQLLVDLAEFDPKRARPGDWLNYHAGLRELCRIVGEKVSAMIFNTGDPQGLRAVKEELQPIVIDLQRIVRQYAAGGEKVGPVRVLVNVAATSRGLFAHGDTRDVAILAAVMLLTKADRPPIGICPEDKRLFVRIRRQEYCSRRCVSRVNARDRRNKAKKAIKEGGAMTEDRSELLPPASRSTR